MDGWMDGGEEGMDGGEGGMNGWMVGWKRGKGWMDYEGYVH